MMTPDRELFCSECNEIIPEGVEFCELVLSNGTNSGGQMDYEFSHYAHAWHVNCVPDSVTLDGLQEFREHCQQRQRGQSKEPTKNDSSEFPF